MIITENEKIENNLVKKEKVDVLLDAVEDKVIDYISKTAHYGNNIKYQDIRAIFEAAKRVKIT